MLVILYICMYIYNIELLQALMHIYLTVATVASRRAVDAKRMLQVTSRKYMLHVCTLAVSLAHYLSVSFAPRVSI